MLFVSSADERSRVNGDAPGAHELAEELSRVDQERWGHLLPTLREIAAVVAPRFADVMSAEDVLGELVLASCDVWLADWSTRVLRCREHRSLHVFLRDRLRDHLREQRRKIKRRRLLLTPTGHGPSVETGDAEQPIAPAIFSSEPPAPDQGLSTEELRRAASGDAQTRAVIALRESGFSQQEIARVLRVSRPTVTRRLGAISAALLAVLAVVAFAWVIKDDPAAESATLQPEPSEPNAEPTVEAPGDPVVETPLEQRPAGPRSPPVEAPSQAPVRHGRITVTAGVPCSVFIDGVARGLTPMQERLTAGEHVLEATCSGSSVYRQTFQVHPGSTISVRVGPDRRPNAIASTDSDPEASVESRARACTRQGDNDCVIALLEGNAESSSAIELRMLIESYRASGNTAHALSYMAIFVRRFPDHRSRRHYEQIMARANQPTSRYIPPAAGSDHGTLRINTMPWTRIFIDGRDTHLNTPQTSIRLTPGRHRIGLRTADGVMHDITITIWSDQMQRIVRRF